MFWGEQLSKCNGNPTAQWQVLTQWRQCHRCHWSPVRKAFLDSFNFDEEGLGWYLACVHPTFWSSGHPWVTYSVMGGSHHVTPRHPPPSLSPSSRPASDWVPLGPPVRRWTSTGWGGCGRHEGREGGHGLPLGGGLGPSGFGPHPGCGPAARPTTAPPPQLPERFRRLLKLTNLTHHSRDTDHGWRRRTTTCAQVYFPKVYFPQSYFPTGLIQTHWKASSWQSTRSPTRRWNARAGWGKCAQRQKMPAWKPWLPWTTKR